MPYHKPGIVLIKLCLISVALVLSACQPQGTQNPAATARPVSILTDYPEVDTQQPAVSFMCGDDLCPDFSAILLVTNHAWVDRFLYQQILQQEAYTDAQGHRIIPADIQEIKTRVRATYNAKTYKAKGLVVRDAEVGFLGVFNRLALFQIVWTEKWNDKPYYAQSARYYVLDMNRQRQLGLNDILVAGQRPVLLALVQQQMRHLPSTAAFADSVTVADNFSFGISGLSFFGQDSHGASRGEILPKLMISYHQLKGIIKPEYLPD